MEIYRNVYTKFWSDDVKVLEEFTPDDKYMFLYLITNSHGNICGCYELPISQVCRETGLDMEKVEMELDRLESKHQVILREGKEVLIINWSKYNWTKSKKLLQSVKKVSRYISSERLRDIVSKQLELYVNQIEQNADIDEDADSR